MNQRRIEQELQNLANDIDYINNDSVIPSRLSRKLQRIPRLSVLEMMFNEPSSSDDYSNYMTTRSATASMRQRYSKNSVSNTTTVPRAGTTQNVNDEQRIVSREQQNGTRASDATTRNAIMESINTPIDLTGPDDPESRVRTRAQELREPPVLPTESSDDDANDVMGLIIKRIFFSLTQSNNSRFANSQPPNPSRSEDPDVIIIDPSPRTSTFNNTRMGQENQAPEHSTSNSNESHQSLTHNKKRTYPKTPQMKRTYNLRSLAKKYGGLAAAGTEKQALDVTVRNKIRKSLMKEKQHDNKTFKMKTRKIIKKSTNSVHIYNIVLKKCDHSKVPSASKAKKLAASKDRNFGECPVCLDKLNISILRATQCGHVFCVSCISNVYNKGDAKCPTCRGFLKPYGYHKLYL